MMAEVKPQQAMAPLLDVAGLAKRFGAVTALSDGGPHGAGRRDPRAARRQWQRQVHALQDHRRRGRARRRIAPSRRRERHARPPTRRRSGTASACFYQELSLVPQLSVADNVFLGHERQGAAGFLERPAGSASRPRGADRALRRRSLGAGFSADAPVARLSADQRQIVEILKVLARKPRLIIFDEATAALDRPPGRDLLRHPPRASGRGRLRRSSSRTAWTRSSPYRDRITVMRNGATVASFATADDRPRTPWSTRWSATLPLHERIEHPGRRPAEPRLG